MIRSKSSASLFLSTITVSIFTLITGLLIARYLGPESRGIIASFTIGPMTAAGLLGLSGGIVANYCVASRNQEALNQYLVTFYFYVSILVSFTTCIVYSVMTKKYEVWPAIIFTILTFTEIFRVACLGVISGQKRFITLALLRALTPATYFAVIVFLYIANKFTAETVLISLVLSNILFAIIIIFVMNTKLSINRQFFRMTVSSIFKFHPTTIVHVLKSNIERIVCVLLLPLDDVGAYFAISALMAVPFQAMQQTFGAQVLTAVSRNEMNGQKIKSLNFLIMILLTITTFLLYYSAPALIDVILGQEFQPYASIAVILYLSSGLKFLSSIQINILQGNHNGRTPLISEFAYLVIFSSMAFIGNSDIYSIILTGLTAIVVTTGYLLTHTYRAPQREATDLKNS